MSFILSDSPAGSPCKIQAMMLPSSRSPTSVLSHYLIHLANKNLIQRLSGPHRTISLIVRLRCVQNSGGSHTHHSEFTALNPASKEGNSKWVAGCYAQSASYDPYPFRRQGRLESNTIPTWRAYLISKQGTYPTLEYFLFLFFFGYKYKINKKRYEFLHEIKY